MAAKIRLGDLLVRAGVLTPTQLEAALAEQRRWGGRLGRVLVQMQFVSEAVLIRALSKQLGIRAADLDVPAVPDALMKKLSSQLLKNHGVCPERYEPAQNVLHLAMADPSNVAVIDEVRFRCGVRVEPAIASERQIQEAITRLFGEASLDRVAHREVEFQTPMPAGPPSPLPSQWAELEGTQHQQEKALRALVDLLIEKGVFTRAQYLELMSKR
jgi:hypothetical protein